MRIGRRDQIPDLHGKVVIVTGGARGLGLTMVGAYLQAGAHVAIFDRAESALRSAAAELTGFAGDILASSVDIRFEDAVDAAVAQVVARFGRIDVLVNNAALLTAHIQGDAPERPPFWEVSSERWRELWDANVTGLWLCSRRVAREMIAQSAGSIINVTTNAQTMVSESHVPYGPSKAAVEAFTRAGAQQLKPFGVRMNALHPGGSVNARGAANPRYSPWDVMVPAALFLASDQSARVIGQSIIAEEYIREHGQLPAGSPRAD